jgi:hypothetical protein
MQIDSFAEDAGCDQDLGVKRSVETIDRALLRLRRRAPVYELHTLAVPEGVGESPDAVFLVVWIPGCEIGRLLGNGLEACGPARRVACEETMHLREVGGGIVRSLEPVDLNLQVRGGDRSGGCIHDICARVWV